MTSPPTTAPASTPNPAATGSAGPTAFSPAANLLRGALIAYLLPRLSVRHTHGKAMINQAVKGLTSRNYHARRQQLIDTLTRLTQGKFGPGADIDDLPALLRALDPEIERADRTTLTVIQK